MSLSELLSEFQKVAPIIGALISGGAVLYAARLINDSLAGSKAFKEQRAKDKRAAVIGLFQAKTAWADKSPAAILAIEANFADDDDVLECLQKFDVAMTGSYADGRPISDDDKEFATNELFQVVLVKSDMCSKGWAECRNWMRFYCKK